MPAPTELNDGWSFRNGQRVVESDTALIDSMLANELDVVRTAEEGWTIIYRHRQTGQLWELSYPRSEMHGGGPRRLRSLKDAS